MFPSLWFPGLAGQCPSPCHLFHPLPPPHGWGLPLPGGRPAPASPRVGGEEMTFSRRTRLFPRRSPLLAQGFGTSFHAPYPFARSRPGSGGVVTTSEPSLVTQVRAGYRGHPANSGCVVTASEPLVVALVRAGYRCPPNPSPSADCGLPGASVRIRMPSRPSPSPCVTEADALAGSRSDS